MSENAELRPAEAGDAAASLAERVVANLGSAVHASAETLRLPLLCLLAEGRECTACIRHCPYQALRIITTEDGFGTSPLVEPSRCNGCGACESVCPVRPRRAIEVVPAGLS